MKRSIVAHKLTILSASLVLLIAAAETSVAQSVLFIRGADRSGGFLEADNNTERSEQLAGIFNNSTSNGNHGWGELREALEDNGFDVDQILEPLESNAPSGQTTGAGINFRNVNLNRYDVLVFGSNNAVYSRDAVDEIEDYIRAGGGAIFISDANFGSDWADASNSDQQFLDRFGLIVNQDNGRYVIDRDEFVRPNDDIFNGVDAIDGEGVTPFRIGSLTNGVDAEILARAEGQTTDNNGNGGLNRGTTRNTNSGDAAVLFATADEGRIICHFDRNTFFNNNGAGTNINRFDNERFAINMFSIAARSQFININGNFRDGLDGWTIEDGRIDLSGRGHDDNISARLRSSGAELTRRVTVIPGTNYRLRGRIESSGRFGYRINQFDRSSTASGAARNYKRRTFEFNSGVNNFIEIYCQYRNRTGRFDNITLENLDGTEQLR